jgi:hypothetical protein
VEAVSSPNRCGGTFPDCRHCSRVNGGRVTVSVQPATVVKFFGADVLPALGRHAAVVEDSVEKIERCLVEAMESTETNALDDMIVPRFRRSSQNTA